MTRSTWLRLLTMGVTTLMLLAIVTTVFWQPLVRPFAAPARKHHAPSSHSTAKHAPVKAHPLPKQTATSTPSPTQTATATSTPSPTQTATTDPSHFTLAFDEEFGGTTLDTSKWGTYYGPQSGNTGNAFNSIACSVGNGELTLNVLARPQDGRAFTTCGLGTWKSSVQTYGKYEFRARIDSGQDWGGLGLLWPSAPHWPPEIDFCEYNDARTDGVFSLHYDPDNKWQGIHITRDFTQWHVYTVLWTPGMLVWEVDGQVQFTTTHNVSSEPMWFGLMAGTGYNAANLGAYHVNWVHIYTYKA